MSIDKRLREDAARFTRVKPPEICGPSRPVPRCLPSINRAHRPVKWFMPAVAMLYMTGPAAPELGRLLARRDYSQGVPQKERPIH